MGIGSESIALYRQFAAAGLFKDVARVAEIGSQDVRCAGYEQLLQSLFVAAGRDAPGWDALRGFATGSGKALYEALGFKYACIDPDERHGALALDLNFDSVPHSHRMLYDFLTNHGTTEHLLNQYNAFEVAHDLTRVGGLMLHVLPFLNYFNHSLYTYRPEFFRSLAQSNRYRLMGMWLNIDPGQPSFLPWSDDLLRQVPLADRCNGALAVLLQRLGDAPFEAPVQVVVDDVQDRRDAVRFGFIADGDLLNRTIAESIRIVGPKDEKAPQPSMDSAERVITLKSLVREGLRRIVRRVGGFSSAAN
jgi:hypothetical protein